jgi:hypothetical protein
MFLVVHSNMINNLLELEDIFWKQRAKRNWYNMGDRNTQYFHAWASQRKRLNHIGSIADLEGNIWTEQQDIGRAFTHFFQNLFTSVGSSSVEECLSSVLARVSPDSNEMLCAVFTPEEVNHALAQMHPLKSPGPDGFGSCFFQKHWQVVGEEVRRSVLDFLNFEIFDPGINSTFITLVPKKSSASSVSDFRPISLCNVLYKLIAKVLANRLKKVLPSLISPAQSAFVPGRLITDNVLVAFEALHSMASRLRGRKGYMAVKLDMSKAYDRVEWCFLEAMMRAMGFAEKWIRLIMSCVSSVTYSVLVNGTPFGRIVPSRGLRQGDPLSPYLFLLVAEGLSAMLVRAEQDRLLTGVPISVRGVRLTHLFFADDSLLFCRANFDEWGNLLKVLEVYEAASGQKINVDKSSIFFSSNTGEEFRSLISAAGFASSSCFEKYLGLPVLVGRSKMRTFEGILSRVRKKVDGWKEKFLSQAGREILIKAVVQAIPMYCMNLFQLPKKLCSNLNSILCRFWWGRSEDARGLASMSWSRVGAPKEKGGMGFRDLEIFNRALLAKQGWRLIKFPESLVARVMKAKYYPDGDFLSAHLGRRPSYAWRSIFQAKRVVEDGLLWRIGDGNSVRIWKDQWLPPPLTSLIHSPHQNLDANSRVNTLIDSTSGWWNVQLLQTIFREDEIARICCICPSPIPIPDTLIWQGTANGQFSVKSAYLLEQARKNQSMGECSKAGADGTFWQKLWKVEAPGVVKNFLWKVGNDLLPTKLNLFKKKIVSEPCCPICAQEPEDAIHILWKCKSSMAVWQSCGKKIQKLTIDQDDGKGLIHYLMGKLEGEDLTLALVLLRLIWLRRNAFVFERVFSPPERIVFDAHRMVREFSSAAFHVDRLSVPPLGQNVSWLPPPPGSVKINWAVFVNRDVKRTGIGVLSRNDRGEFVAAQTKFFPSLLNLSLASALGAWFAVNLGGVLGAPHVHLEGDRREVVSALMRGGSCDNTFGHLIEDANLRILGLPKVDICLVSKQANVAALCLASLACSQCLDGIWLGVCPPLIWNVLSKMSS